MSLYKENPNAFDVAIVGGSIAGLSAALTLGRGRRSVVLVDDDKPRNAAASHAYNVFTRDGTPPDELRRIGREQLKPYDVQLVNNRVMEVKGDKGAFTLCLKDGHHLAAARLLLATGVTDDLPDVPGLRELWGKSVFACPYCHGWEVKDMPLAVLGDGEAGHSYARLIQNWSRDLVLLTGENTTLKKRQTDELQAVGITAIEADVVRYESGGGKLSALHLSDGQCLARNAVFTRTPVKLQGRLHHQLGCDVSDDERQVVVDETGQTSVPGIYAAGDMVSPLAAVITAAASGTRAAGALNHEFVMSS